MLLAALSALPPLITGRIVDALQHRGFSAAIREVGTYAVVVLATAAVSFGNSYFGTVLRENFARDLRVRLISQVHRASLTASLRFSTGEAMNRIMGDIDAVVYQLQYALLPTGSATLALIAMCILMFKLNVTMAAVACLATLILILPQHFAKPRFSRLRKQLSESKDRLQESAQETLCLGALMSIKGANSYAVESARAALHADSIRNVNVEQAVVGGKFSFVYSAMQAVGPFVVLAIGAYFVAKNALSLGTLVAFLAYQNRMVVPFNTISGTQIQFAAIMVIMRRLMDLLNLPDEDSGIAAFQSGDISFDSVSAGYGDRIILTEASFNIKSGEHVAFVGESGSGKSTIVSLLLRFLEIRSGTVTIGGRQITDIMLSDLRSKVALVPQESFLFSDSVERNIRYGNVNARSADFEEVVKACKVDSIVAKLPRGYSTLVGMHDVRLSGGERQRICLARAVLQNPDILILDEALTGVDLAVEQDILLALQQRFREKTLIVVSHRLNSLAALDRIMIVDGGKISAAGSPTSLLQASEWYRSMLAGGSSIVSEAPSC